MTTTAETVKSACRLLIALLLVAAWTSTPASADGGRITVVNNSGKDAKVVAPGGGAVVPGNGEPTAVSFEEGVDVGVEIGAWWLGSPRDICQIFVRWDGELLISGERAIHCIAR